MGGDYSVYDIAPEELASKYSELRTLDGYNITIPHKQAIIPLIDKLDNKAQLYGSVNTVKNGEIAEGYTTDPDGFLMALKAAKNTIREKRSNSRLWWCCKNLCI